MSARDLLHVEARGAVLQVRLARPAKRNAINDALLAQLRETFASLPEETRAVVFEARRASTSAPASTSPRGRERQRRRRHRPLAGVACGLFEQIQFGRVPVVAVLHGAVVGGGLAPASACRVRVAEQSAHYGLPRGPAWPVRRRRRVGADPAADRRRADGRHDKYRPRLRRRRRPGDRPFPIRRRDRPRARQGDRAGDEDRGQRAALESRRPARLCRASPRWGRARACSPNR